MKTPLLQATTATTSYYKLLQATTLQNIIIIFMIYSCISVRVHLVLSNIIREIISLIVHCSVCFFIDILLGYFARSFYGKVFILVSRHYRSGDKMSMPRYIFLNALPLQALNITKPTKLVVTPVKPSVLKQMIPLMRGKIENYIRHPATVQLINKLFDLDLQPSSQLYSYSEGDVIYVFTLKKPVRGKEIDNVDENDIAIYQVEVLSP